MSLWREKVLVSVGIQAVIAGVFLRIEAINAATALPAPAWLATPFDRALPLVPYAVWPYVSWYAFPVVLLMLGREDFRRASAAVLVSFLVCAVGYVLLPVAMERAPLEGHDGTSAIVLGAVYAIDHPRNIFPSFHAALCATVLGVIRGTPRTRLLLAAWVAAICLSCILTKQHYALDVVAGLVVGAGAVAAVDAARRRAARAVALPARRSASATSRIAG